MTIVRTVPDIRALDLSVSRSFYQDLLGFKVVMDQANMVHVCVSNRAQAASDTER